MDPAEEQEARRALGRMLRGLREPAYTQHSFAAEINYSRSTVANVETARQRVPREFWSTCDVALGTDGLLVRAHDELVAALLARQRTLAEHDFDRLAQARLPADEAASRHQPVDVDYIAAGVWAAAASEAVYLDRSTVDDMLVDLTDLSHEYGAQHRSITLTQGAHVFQGLQVLLATAVKRSDRAEIHLAMALTSALMASAAFDLSRTPAAVDLARAARLFADQSGDPNVLGWVLGLTASFHNWLGRPSRALREAECGLELKVSDSARFRLLHIAARSQALLANDAAVQDLLREAEALPTQCDGGDMIGQIAGEFAFDQARAAACAGAAWLDLGSGEAAALALTTAIKHYRLYPGTGPAAPLLGAQLDLVSAQVLADRADEAIHALSDVQPLLAQHNIAVVQARTVALQRRIESRAWRSSSQAATLLATLEQWTTESRTSL